MSILTGRLRAWLCRTAVCLSLCSICAAQERPTTNAIQWRSEGGRSAGGRDLEVLRAGNGPQAIVILGSLTGNEPSTVQLMDQVAEMVRKFPPPSHIRFILIRSANPDGVAEHVATNAAGADLNRAFSSAAALPGGRGRSRPTPEVDFLEKLLREAKPLRVIQLRANYTPRALVEMNASWPELKGQSVLASDVTTSRFTSDYRIGSLEEFTQLQLNAQMANIHLPAAGGTNWQPADVLRFATASIPLAKAEGGRHELVSDSANGPRSPLSKPMPDDAPAQRRAPREVEFLPVPPEFLATSNAGPNGQGARPRYQDLPAPPRNGR